MKNSLRVLSVFLSIVMIFGMIPMTVNAESADTSGKFSNSQLTVATEKNSTLAPGIAQDSYTVYDKNGDQVKMFITTADMSVDTVKLFTSYKDMDPTNYGMSKLTEQVDAFNAKAEVGDEYYQGTVVAGINSSYYNMINGKPTGAFVMNGVDVTTESEGNAYGYFAVMKDGSVKIGKPGDYSNDKGNIQEAIGIWTMLIADGQICSGLNTTQKYPRQTIGITADGNVILMTADGNQAPKSIGLTVQEQAEVMLDLGCVWAGHLDGGGSCTYAAKAEGSNDFAIQNSPSDGSERSISNGFIMVSTAVSDGKFHSASLTAENEYVTPGSTVKVSASGVDKAGGSAEVPSDIAWQLADSSFGTVSNGVFSSNGKEGQAVIQVVYGDKVVGETVINVVVPDKIAFASAEMTVPYSKSVDLGISATFGARDVTLKPADIKFTFSNSAVGSVSGFTFTACEENPAVTSSDITATLVYDETVTASSKITLGKGSEVVYDFEDGTNQGLHFDETPGTEYNYVFPETSQEVVNGSTGKVHSGNNALSMNVNYANSLESGYMKTSLYAEKGRVFENAVRIGAWIYIPDEFVGLWARWTLKAVNNIDETGKITWGSSVNSNTMDTTAGGTGVVYTFDEPGWHYLSADVSQYSRVGWADNGVLIQFYISDRDGSAYNYVAADQSNIPAEYQLYLDDITVDYSTAVDDREAPVFSNVTYAVEGMADAAVLNGQTVTSNKVTFGASVADYTGKTNFTGIDASTVKAYIDGVEYAATYANGMVSVTDVELTNGKHTVKFAACDNMGNYASVYRNIVVNASESKSTVKLVATDATATRIKLDSIYNMDLVATAIEDVQSVEVVVDLDNNSTWQLEHMILADGFSATYSVDEAGNIATIKLTRTGENTQTGEAALATIPVRVWTLKTGYVYPNGTLAGSQAKTLKQFRDGQEFWRMSVIAEVDKGVLTRVDNSTSTFTGERVFCDTEMWGNYAKMSATADGLAYYNAWDGGHVHSAVAMADLAPTCTKTGYTGRTFCEGCNSVADWGTTVPATGHTYGFVDGVLKCACGELFNGEYTDGKTYVDGVVIADGWVGESYYKSGVKLIGLQSVDGYYYLFDNSGICEGKARADGFCYNEEAGSYMYMAAGIPSKGDVAINLEVHFFDENGYAYSGEKNILGYVCNFDEKGLFLSAADGSVLEAGCVGTNLEYVLLADGTLLIDGEGAMRDYTVSGSYGPWFYNNMANVKYVQFGSGVTALGEYAFNRCEYIKTVTFANGSELETIGKYAFRACHRLDRINIPASVTTIEDYAFFKCGGLTTVDFEANSKLNYLGREAFTETHYLKKILIPASVTTIGDRLFIRSKADVVVQVVKDSVGYFYAVNNSIKYELVDGVVPALYSGDVNEDISWALYPNGSLVIIGSGEMPNYASQNAQPWAGVRHLVKKIVIGKDITSIGNYAFAYCEGTEEIVFEEGSKLEKIGVLSFRSAYKVTDVVLPETVTYLNTYAFGTCKALVNVYIPQGMGTMHAKAFVESPNVILNVAEGTYGEKYAVDNGIKYETRDFVYTAIASGTCGTNATWAFYENGELIISGNGEIPNFASHAEQPWASVRHLVKKIVIGKDITAIGNYAFAYCEGTEEIVFEEGSKLQKIGVLSFRTMRKLTEVILPETVNYLNAYAFGTCPALVNVYIPQGMSFMHVKAFIESTNVVLNVAEGTYGEKYAVDNGINHTVRDFVYIPVVSGTCGENATWAFYENGELIISGSGEIPNYSTQKEQPWASIRHLVKKIVIGKDITVIGNYAFAYCENTEEIVFEEGSKLEKIGVLAFRTARKVTEIVLPETVTYLNAYAFGTCPALINIYIPQGMEFMHTKAFIESTNVILNVAEGTYAHKYAQTNNLKYETRDFVYTAIASGSCGENATWAFYENGELIISGSGAIDNYTSHKEQPWASIRHLVKKIVIGKDITVIGNYAFAYCENTEEIVFEEGSKLEKIGVLAFRTARKVTEVILPETVTFINAYAFGTCPALVNVYIPEGAAFIHANAFVESTNVVLSVADGSYAQQYAVSNNVAYTAR
ncbi:MAG: leucine-rich repeat protein [Clostridia bacterium]|nr:leucine-rich repeat protein [Clostridia bacterium]